jgi:filamentous hemagglutinin
LNNPSNADHGNLKLSKEAQGVFYGHLIEVAENAWQSINTLSIKPIKMSNRDVYIIPRGNSGYAGG